MEYNDIKNLVLVDESRTLELKKTTGELQDGMHSACAFLNTVLERSGKQVITMHFDG